VIAVHAESYHGSKLRVNIIHKVFHSKGCGNSFELRVTRAASLKDGQTSRIYGEATNNWSQRAR
jgi:hypothetical protein